MTRFSDYVNHGWALCPIPSGTKGPRTAGWQLEENAVRDPQVANSFIGAGLCHAYSGTCAIDIDSLEEAKQWLTKNGIDLEALLSAPDAVQITSGRLSHLKLIYRLDSPLPSIVVTKTAEGKDALNFRCGTNLQTTVQDVLPPTIHPDTGKPYQWIGDWTKIPPIPAVLIKLWTDVISATAISASSGIASVPTVSSIIIPTQIKTILDSKDPSCGYDEWIKIGMALHHETGGSNEGLALWDEWSANSEKYAGLANLQSHWSSFGRSLNPITLDSIQRKILPTADDFQDESNLAALFASEPIAPLEFQFLDLKDLFARPEPEWIIKGVLPEAALGVIYGPHSTGKTFTAVDLALSISLGQPWRGRDTKQGRVLYVAAEDDRGIQIRLAAGLAARGCTTAPIRVLPTAPVLTDKAQQEALLKAIKHEKRPSIIFFDTLAATTPGADENSGKEMGEVVGFCHKLYEATGALIMLIHHEGKTEGRGPRGWSGLGGAFEVIWKMSTDDLQHELEIEKVKNAAKGDLFSFRLLPVGNSCIVEWI